MNTNASENINRPKPLDAMVDEVLKENHKALLALSSDAPSIEDWLPLISPFDEEYYQPSSEKIHIQNNLRFIRYPWTYRAV